MKIHPYFLVFALSVVSSATHAKPAAGYEGMVSTAHPAASEAGVAMLRQGGNAADAAAAAAFTLAVAEPYSSGIGGGGFALTSFKGSQAFLDFREVAPMEAHRDMYLTEGVPNKRLSRDGVLAAGVPGAVAGYLDLHARWGALSRAQIMQPAITLAREGFKVTPRYVAYVKRRLEVLSRDPEMARVFLVPSPEGEGHVAPPVGHLLRQPDLARTLTLIAQRGAQAFYTGTIAKRLVADMSTRGGLISARDLSTYQVRDRQPLVGSYRGHAIVSSPPPSSGGQILLTLLNIMETLPADTPWRSLEALHLYIEGSKRAFADRALLGDPLFVPYLDALLPNLLTKDRARLIAKIITPTATPATAIPAAQGSQVPPGLHTDIFGPQSAGRDTTHLSVLDKHGNAVSMTTTINPGWGAGVVARDTGVVWNNE
ncbi:MAG: gamma-glutamyltransferase, partial [Myxococcota bacterium]|nr:gamma-glutamyltransferase [Myxococcota bacterium]